MRVHGDLWRQWEEPLQKCDACRLSRRRRIAPHYPLDSEFSTGCTAVSVAGGSSCRVCSCRVCSRQHRRYIPQRACTRAWLCMDGRMRALMQQHRVPERPHSSARDHPSKTWDSPGPPQCLPSPVFPRSNFDPMSLSSCRYA